jgi:hypothetical protein
MVAEYRDTATFFFNNFILMNIQINYSRYYSEMFFVINYSSLLESLQNSVNLSLRSIALLLTETLQCSVSVIGLVAVDSAFT